MGGSSVPSSTTQTTMLDPMRQAALKKSMGYFDKWANSYNGPTYQGPLVAGRTADWYKAQDMAHRLSNRFAEGGLTSVRRFGDGGDTTAQPWWSGYNDAQDAQDAGVTPPTDNTNVDTNSTVTGGTTNDTVTGGDYTAKPASGNAGNPNLLAQSLTATGVGGLYGLTKALPNQVSSNYTAGTISPGTVSSNYTAGTFNNGYTAGTITPGSVTSGYKAGTITPGSVTSGYTAGTITPGSVTSGYTAGTITPGTVTSGYTAGTITPGSVAYSYTPDKLTAPSAMTSDYTAGAHDIKDVIAKDWNQAAMEQYMSPYTQGVVDIALREAERQHAIDLQKQSTAATQSGAFGGYRQGVVEAEGNRNYGQLRSDITTKGRQDAYTAAVTQFNADKAVDVATQQFNQNNSLANYQALQQAQSNAAQLKLTAAQNNASNTINAYQAIEQAKQAAAAGNLTASQANAANALSASIASEQAKQQAGQMGLTASTANAANALSASIASEQAKQQAGQMGLTASTANAANALNASIASEQAKQQAGQMGLTASTANAANALNASIASEQAKQQAGQMDLTASTANAANTLTAAQINETSKQKAAELGLTASQYTETAKAKAAELGLAASTANATNLVNAQIATENAKQQAAQLNNTDQQNNVNNGIKSLETAINAFNSGIAGARAISDIETAYQTNMANAAGLLNSTDASARSAAQALIEATNSLTKLLDNIDLTKAQASAEIPGIKNVNTGTVQVNK
jgi:hypothetical protein